MFALLVTAQWKHCTRNLPNCGKTSYLNVYHLRAEMQCNTCRVMFQTGMVKTSLGDITDAAKFLRYRKVYGKGSEAIESYYGLIRIITLV